MGFKFPWGLYMFVKGNEGVTAASHCGGAPSQTLRSPWAGSSGSGAARVVDASLSSSFAPRLPCVRP